MEIDTGLLNVKDYDIFYIDAVSGRILRQGGDAAELPDRLFVAAGVCH
jgi:hypothetical protein